MNTISFDPASLSHARFLANNPIPQPLLAQDQPDILEAILRVLLVLCLVASPLLCGLQATSHKPVPAPAAVPSQAAAWRPAPAPSRADLAQA